VRLGVWGKRGRRVKGRENASQMLRVTAPPWLRIWVDASGALRGGRGACGRRGTRASLQEKPYLCGRGGVALRARAPGALRARTSSKILKVELPPKAFTPGGCVFVCTSSPKRRTERKIGGAPKSCAAASPPADARAACAAKNDTSAHAAAADAARSGAAGRAQAAHGEWCTFHQQARDCIWNRSAQQRQYHTHQATEYGRRHRTEHTLQLPYLQCLLRVRACESRTK
jgi:hypothetical protein